MCVRIDLNPSLIKKQKAKLHEELSKNDEALGFFNSINPSSKRFALRWIKLAKTEKTRTNRILELVELSAKGEKLPGS